MRVGSPAHRELFCRSLLETHRAYDPAQFPWPDLDAETLAFLRGIPFWQEALATEKRAGVMARAFAEEIDDPLLRAAVALQADEEARHGRLLASLVQRYGIPVVLDPPYTPPKNLKQAFIDFGYSECLDSFFAFGFFRIAQQSGFFPEALLTLFDPILDEEARHIVFFVNWMAYQQACGGRGFFLYRGLNTLWNYSKALRHLLRSVRRADASGAGFTATGALVFAPDLTLRRFLATCVQENERRMQAFDPELLQPRLLPHLSRLLLTLWQRWPQKRTQMSPA
ncbi:MAG: ferritin-like domain-containing protein [Gloeomargarita sp. SKYBB_i_bin120]|nr:ferritin-like domain-containing protein [Gloeomargarita sp. SKYG98]MCS7291442.1 ferritin-like domain-containing protein [Gloeomargarita sp. SKYB120]MDW8177002.1 ferritin-like domain-containing protein [Gloeomargarita sp. SKYBB_i_bin120]